MRSSFGRSSVLCGSAALHPRAIFAASAGLALSVLIILLALFGQAPAPVEGAVVRPNEAVMGTVQLLAADRLIREGEALSSSAFKTIYWPARSVPPEAVRDSAELAGKFAKADIQPLDPVRRSQITAETRTGNPFEKLHANMRAVTIEVDAEKGVDGFVVPGSWVDVVLTSAKGSEVLVPRVQVLSFLGRVQETTRPGGRSQEMPRAATVTLEVKPEDGLRINYSKTTGTLSLMLRRAEDTDTREIEPVRPERQAKPPAAPKSEMCGRIRIGGSEYQIPCKSSIPIAAPPEV